MSDKMKPCPNPWCGHKHDGPHLEKFGPTVASMWNVTCFCETTGPCAAKPSDAIAAWNTRPDPAKDALVAALKAALETIDGIANSNWRKWEDLASPEEFERWVKSRTMHESNRIRAALSGVEE